jgi:hypothetical protein
MIKETLNYLFEEKKQEDGNIGVVHVYRKADNAWVGFIRYIKESLDGKPFVKFFASDLGQGITNEFKQELSQFSKSMAQEWKEKDGIDFKVNSNLDVKFNMIIDKGDGTPPKKVTV